MRVLELQARGAVQVGLGYGGARGSGTPVRALRQERAVALELEQKQGHGCGGLPCGWRSLLAGQGGLPQYSDERGF